MHNRLFHPIRAAAIFALAAAFVSFAAEASEPDYKAVQALFAEHCFDCHGVKDPEGKLVLESYELLMKGGESGPSVVPGKSSESLLVKLVEGTLEKDGKKRVMPPGKRKKLEPRDIAEIRAWIDAGAKPSTDTSLASKKIEVPKIEPKVPPRRAINALAYEPKSKLLAVGRVGEVELQSVEQQLPIRILSGIAGNVNALVFSSDGKLLFGAGGDAGIQGEIRQWNVADGTLVRTIQGHTDAIYSLALSPDGKLLASGSYDQKIKLWKTDDGSEARTLSGHNGCIYALAFRGDGKILASASGDRTVKLWEPGTGERRDTLSQPLKEQYALAFSPDGRRLLAGGADRRIRVWEISEEARETTNPLLHSKFAHEGSILRLAFSSDGKSLASSADDKTLKLWDPEEIVERRVFEPQPDWVAGIAFVLENKGLAAGRLDGSLAYYRTQDGSILPPPKPELTRIEPNVVTRGVPTKVRLSGKNLQRLTGINFDRAGVLASILTNPAPSGSEAWLEVRADPSLARGSWQLSLANGTGSARLYTDDLPVQSGAAGSTVTLPVTLFGVHRVSGQRDLYDFSAGAGQTIVFDAAAKLIGSKADLVLSLLDSEGTVLASNNGFDKSGDPLLVYNFPKSGAYRLLVQELVPAASDDHFYRVAMGAFPFVTAVFPPVIQRNTESDLELIGFNLDGELLSGIVATNGTEFALSLDPAKYRWRGDLKVAVSTLPVDQEWEPNDRPSDASSFAVPGTVAGRITMRGQSDWYRFEAKAGELWVVETRAQASDSPLDTRVEIRDAQGAPIVRTLLQAVRDSAVTFRGIDSQTVDCRVDNWEEMELNQYLYLQGEVVRLFRAPQGPDSGFNFYGANGSRRTYFDTTASAHANAEPCYIVEPHPPGTKVVDNGLPVFPIYFENDDDDSERKLGRDSRVYFTAPAEGAYTIRVTDTRGFGGDRFIYSLTVRRAQPDFKISIEGANATVPKGSGQRFAVHADRVDGFDGEIRISLTNVPPGFIASNPIMIQAGHGTAFGTLYASEKAESSTEPIKLVALAEIAGQTVERDAGTLGKLTVANSAPLYVELEPEGAAVPEITIAPGGIVPARLKIRRNGHAELVTFQVENLPHGIIVDNIGLNGVLIPKDQNEREIFFNAAKWVPETDRLCYAISNEAGRQTSRPILVKVRKSGGQIAKK